jgi:hypothetical protein
MALMSRRGPLLVKNISTPAAAEKFFRDETDRYAKLIRKIGLKID